MATMLVIYPTPTDVDAFDRHYFDVHVPLAKTLPGLKRYDVNAGPIATPVGNPNIHRIGALYFENMAAMQKAFASPEGQAAAADRRLFAPDGSGMQMFLFDTKEL